MEFKEYKQLDKIIEVEYKLFQNYESLSKLEQTNKDFVNSLEYKKIVEAIKNQLTLENNLFNYFNDIEARVHLEAFLDVASKQNTKKEATELLIEGAKEPMIQKRISNILFIKDNLNDKSKYEDSYLMYLIQMVLAYRLENMFITSDINDKKGASFVTNSKYKLAFMTPSIENELLDTSFQKVKGKDLLLPKNQRIKDFFELIGSLAIENYTGELFSLLNQNKNDELSKKTKIMLVFNLRSIIGLLSKEQIEQIELEFFACVNKSEFPNTYAVLEYLFKEIHEDENKNKENEKGTTL